jgi:hypothetical protein
MSRSREEDAVMDVPWQFGVDAGRSQNHGDAVAIFCGNVVQESQ